MTNTINVALFLHNFIEFGLALFKHMQWRSYLPKSYLPSEYLLQATPIKEP